MCIFCKLANNEIETDFIYEDDDVVAFLDANPISKMHTLVVPKVHSKNIYDTDPETLHKMMEVVQIIAKDYESEYQIKGFNLVANNNEVANQSVDHIHFHIIPRYEDSDLTFKEIMTSEH